MFDILHEILYTVHTESTSAESSSFKDNPVPLLPRAEKSEVVPLEEFTAEEAPRGRPPLSLSPLFRESTDGHSRVLLRRLPSLRRKEGLCYLIHMLMTIDHFTVVGKVTWHLTGSEAGVDLVLIQTSLLLLCKSSCSHAN